MNLVFVGNRRFVLEEMIRNKVSIKSIFVIQGTHLERNIAQLKVSYVVIRSREELLEHLERIDFDILISNGCPYILPISKMAPRIYANIHPSFLPDLKGVDPVIGSILLQRDSGATCHLMNEQIDGGDIISQVKIPYTNDLDVSTLYQLSFIAEKKAFACALEREFKPLKKQEKLGDERYFTRKPEDRLISFQESIQELSNKTKAFNNRSQGCSFSYAGKSYRVHEMRILENPFLTTYANDFQDLVVLLNYENCIVFKRENKVVLLRSYTDDLSPVTVATSLV